MSTYLKKLSLCALLALSGSTCAMNDFDSSHANTAEKEPLSVAILASGNGTNAEAIWRYFEQPEKEGIIKPAVMICNRKNAKVFGRAAYHGVPSIWLPASVRSDMSNEQKEVRRKAYAQDMIDVLKEHGVTPENGLVCGAGFMVIIHKDFLDYFENRVINIHPTLLPQFPGDTGIADAWEYGVVASGPTVHIVDEGVDTGPIIAQNPFIKQPEDTCYTFEEKTHRNEWRLYPWVVEQIARGNMKVVDKSAEGGPKRCVVMPPQPRYLNVDNDGDAH